MTCDYGKTIRQLRAEMDVSQQQLADILRVSFISVNRWENGHHEPTIIAKERLNKLFKHYKIELEEKQ